VQIIMTSILSFSLLFTIFHVLMPYMFRFSGKSLSGTWYNRIRNFVTQKKWLLLSYVCIFYNHFYCIICSEIGAIPYLRPPTAAAWVQSQVRSCGISGVFFPITSVFPASSQSTTAPNSLIILTLTLYSLNTDRTIK
jgi:hypothetical protein